MSKKPAPVERRYTRCDVFSKARVVIGDKSYKASVVNLSVGGAAVVFEVETDQRPEPGTQLFLEVEGVGKLNGFVARHLGEGLAITLIVSENKKDQLAAFLMKGLNGLMVGE